jgi:hypothetical protein
MQRRRFLKVASQLGASLGIAAPVLAAHTLNAADGSGKDQPKAPTLAFSLDGEWAIATDPRNIGRESNWFRSPQAEAKPTRVPSIIQETFPAYHGVVWYWREFDLVHIPMFWAVTFSASTR